MLQKEQLSSHLFDGFIRRQIVTKCRRYLNGQWTVQDAPFIDDWDQADYQMLLYYLQRTVDTGGAVFGAFQNGILKGFASIEGTPMGVNGDYLDLSSLHVSADMRRNGIGRTLFFKAAEWARAHGAKKLYISSHSAIETQAFYQAMGCTEAAEYNKAHVEQEPYDCQLEFVL